MRESPLNSQLPGIQMKTKRITPKKPPVKIDLSTLESVAENLELQANRERIEAIKMRNWA